MRRRDLIILGGAVVALPLAARAQHKAVPVIGFLSGTSPSPAAPSVAAFHRGLGETGYVEGQNVTFEYRWAEDRDDRLPELAADLVRRKADVIVATGGLNPVRAAKKATSTIPIVFTAGSDPVVTGLVASFARPGGNLTGISFLGAELNPKRLELLSELLPQASVIALLVNPNNESAEPVRRDVQEAARAKSVQLVVVTAAAEGEIDLAFASLVEARAGALVLGGGPLFYGRREQLVTLAARHSVPVIYYRREFVAEGGLMSYGASLTDAYRLAGIYAARILKGEKPADLPVQQSTKFELVINLKTAKALGLIVPQSLLARADEIIE